MFGSGGKHSGEDVYIHSTLVWCSLWVEGRSARNSKDQTSPLRMKRELSLISEGKVMNRDPKAACTTIFGFGILSMLDLRRRTCSVKARSTQTGQ